MKSLMAAQSRLDSTNSTPERIFTQRQLSIRGRATIVNSLLFSKLWYVLRLTPFNQNQLHKLRQVGTAFINRGIFPKLSLEQLTSPRSQGGLATLDPNLQQSALVWRWLGLLLRTTDSSRLTVVMTYLLYTFKWFCKSTILPSFHYYLLFPNYRRAQWFPRMIQGSHLSFMNIFKIFTHAIDSTSFSIRTSSLNPFTTLPLSILDVLQSPETDPHLLSRLVGQHPGVRDIRTTDVLPMILPNYEFDYGMPMRLSVIETSPTFYVA
ncbi:hypothetical protein BDF20DRAFT_913969 [Mycotypha africana]|uniref:uncharacterized protein n=1 Tax=Mycotypha africana TaxID=64632 RepID=UPI0022FFCB34|nr:uncharacterized protein BDF20DRAFT_913969 [Mycotypha africana]KAI8977660.1 hypothetical protein BDF20DRAFT_913969 [Mycotypha africana]